jgi:hypothetical protein
VAPPSVNFAPLPFAARAGVDVVRWIAALGSIGNMAAPWREHG